jgi:3-oxoacyl-[acyl-carrier protein] reductase
MKTLENKTILVTGAAKGIGAAISEKILKAGGNVVMHWHSSPDAVERLKQQFGAGRITDFQADLSKAADVDLLFESAVGAAGGLDGIVNNAAVISSVEADDTLEAWRREWQYTMSVNVQAMADLCRYAILYFKEKGGGSIVNISSRAAFRGDRKNSMHYAASKGAVVALTRSIAKGYARDRIFAYNIAPGWVDTERVRPTLEATGNEFMIDEIPMGHAAPPCEVGNLAVFLLCGLATSSTGATFDINGASYFH